MDNIGVGFLMIIILGIIFLLARVCVLMWCEPERKITNRPVNRRVIQRIRIEPANIAGTTTATTTTPTSAVASSDPTGEDRQGNIFTIADETANNSMQNRCPDFFYVEPSAADAARIRAQLEKDEKDLPTYEEVMAMSAAQAQAGSLGVPPHNISNTLIATTTTIVPPYLEVNATNVSQQQHHQAPPPPPAIDTNGAPVWPMLTSPTTGTATGMNTTTTTGSGAASTSRAAAAAATNTLTTVTISNSVSNTSV